MSHIFLVVSRLKLYELKSDLVSLCGIVDTLQPDGKFTGLIEWRIAKLTRELHRARSATESLITEAELR